MSMTIDSVDLESSTSGYDSSGVRYTRTYLVKFHGTWDEATVLYSASIPARNSDHPSDTNAYAAQASCQMIDADSPNPGGSDHSYAKVTVQYAQKSTTFDPNPLSRPAKISWGGANLSETVTKDTSGAAIKNSAEDLYDPLPTRPVRLAVTVQINRNESSNPASNIIAYSNTTNNATWNGVTAGLGLIGQITAEKITEIYLGVPVTYYSVTYPITFRGDGWKLKLIDNGYRKKVSGVRQSVVDTAGNTPSVPVLLDGSGGELAVGGTPVVYPTAGYTILDSTNWATLSLPNVFA